jgi:6-hydroxytryprostatin B O-methyltransferase
MVWIRGRIPDRNRQFAGYMRAVTSGQEVSLNHLVKGWDWNRLGKALVIDVSTLLLPKLNM